ncbi:unnamed protein product, partial [Choristocarpus tenellus]
MVVSLASDGVRDCTDDGFKITKEATPTPAPSSAGIGVTTPSPSQVQVISTPAPTPSPTVLSSSAPIHPLIPTTLAPIPVSPTPVPEKVECDPTQLINYDLAIDDDGIPEVVVS